MKFSQIRNKVLLILLITSFILFLNFFQTETKNLFYLVSSPIQKSLWRAGMDISNFLETIVSIENLKKENESLKMKNQELMTEVASLKELKIENEILKQALNLNLEKEFELKLVRIIAKDASGDYLIIDKGEKDGLKVGLPVITQQKLLVGKIGEVYPNFSKVILIFSSQSSFDAKIQEKEIYGLIKGAGNGKIFLDLVPREKELQIGDIVVTSALGGNFPPGLLVGEIETIIKKDIAPFQEADLKIAFDIKDLDTLFIIKNFESF